MDEVRHREASMGPFTYDNVDRMEESFDNIVIFLVDGKEACPKPSFAEVIDVVGSFCARFSDAEV